MEGEQKNTRWLLWLGIFIIFVITFIFALYIGFFLGFRFENNKGEQQPSPLSTKNQSLVVADSGTKDIFPEIPYYSNLKWAKYQEQIRVLFVNNNKVNLNNLENILPFDMNGDLSKASIHPPEPKPARDYLPVGETVRKYYRDKLKTLGYIEEISFEHSGQNTIQYNLHRGELIQSVSLVTYLNKGEGCEGAINNISTDCEMVSGEDFELFVSDPYKLEQK